MPKSKNNANTRAALRQAEDYFAGVTLPAGCSDQTFFDGFFAGSVPGLGLRLRAGGSRTWIYRYRVGSRQPNVKIGPGSIDLATARRHAAQLALEVQAGGDPARSRKTAKVEAENTVAILVRQYLEEHVTQWRTKTHTENRRYLTKYAAPLHRLPIAEVSQRDVATLLRNIASTRGDVTSNRCRTALETFVAWVIRQGIRLPEGNVVSLTAKRKEVSRERVLSMTELRRIWCAAGATSDFGAVLKLLILTGAREAEIGGLRWDEVHDDQIVIPAHRSKNKRPHAIPLSNAARTILDQRLDRGRPHIFGTAGFRGWADAKLRLDARIAETGGPLPHWTFHDLRRSCATHMAGLQVQPHVIEAVLNHVSGFRRGVAGVYNRASYQQEKRAALNLWATHIMAAIEDRAATVVPLKRA
jgi:integrase